MIRILRMKGLAGLNTNKVKIEKIDMRNRKSKIVNLKLK